MVFKLLDSDCYQVIIIYLVSLRLTCVWCFMMLHDLSLWLVDLVYVQDIYNAYMTNRMHKKTQEEHDVIACVGLEASIMKQTMFNTATPESQMSVSGT